MIKKEKNTIFDKSFYESIKLNNCIYRLYFNNYENNCYINYSVENVKDLIKKIRNELWVSYFGLKIGEEKNNSIYLTEKQFSKLNIKQKNSLEYLLQTNRKRMLDAFNRDAFQANQAKYIKLFNFMFLNNLKLKDLKIEIIHKENYLDVNILKNESNQLNLKYKTYRNGFNATSIINNLFFKNPFSKQYCEIFFKDFLNIKNIQMGPENFYECWNLYWNFFQLYKLTTKIQPLYWLIYWNELELATFKKQNLMQAQRAFNEFENKFLKFKPLLFSQLKNVINYVPVLYQDNYNSIYFDFIKDFQISKDSKKHIEMIENLKLCDLIEKDKFIENMFLCFKNDYLKWKAKFQHILQYLDNYNYLNKIFETNIFLNTINIRNIINYFYNLKNSVFKSEIQLIDLAHLLIQDQESLKLNYYNSFAYNFYVKNINNLLFVILIMILNPKIDDVIFLNKILSLN